MGALNAVHSAAAQDKNSHGDYDVKPDGNVLVSTDTAGEKSVDIGQVFVEDLFLPLRDVAPYNGERILTVRAVLTGAVLGSMISCSNLYLGLKTGFGADATLFSAIFGYGILKLLERSKVPLVSGYFGPHENNIVQATALGCIGVGFIFVSGAPALIQMGLIGTEGKVSYGALVCLTAISGFFGLGFTVPLRSMFILKLARQLNLYFPLGTASAMTIRALHSKTEGSATARQNLTALSIVFTASLVWAVATSYAPGILYNWNVFWWIYKWGGSGIIGAVSWGWLAWSWSPSMIGMGMFVGLNPALSFLLGSVLAWGIIGPILVHTGAASGIPISAKYTGLVTYNAFNPTTFVSDPSPRYWILWPAVFMMLAVSLTTIALEAKSLGRLAQYGASRFQAMVRRGGRREDESARSQRQLQEGELEDPIAREHRVRWWEWSAVATAAFILAMVCLRYVFHVSGEMALLNLVLGLLWSFVVIQVFGAVGTSPIATVAKGTQFITGAILREQVEKMGYNNAARSNLVGATISSGAAQQAAELVQDFRTGYLLGTPMRAQWYAQLIGTIVATLLVPGLFMLFSTAYTCILDATVTDCPFAMPSVTAWRIITMAILSPTMPLSRSSWITSIIFSVVGIASVILKRWVSRHPTRSHLEGYIPNMSVVGLSMTLPGSSVAMTFLIGAVAAALWKRYGFDSHAKFMYAVAAGMVAGEGVGYVVLSVLQIAKVGGPAYFGTKIGCVAEMC